MKAIKIDLINTYVIFAGGIAQLFGTFMFFDTAEEPAFWFFNGGLTLILVGMLNMLRIKHGSELQLIRKFCLAANVLILAFWLVMAYFLFYKFTRYPLSLLGTITLVLSTLFSSKLTVK